MGGWNIFINNTLKGKKIPEIGWRMQCVTLKAKYENEQK